MIEAMKQALEALELMYACYAHPEWISHKQQEEKILAQCVATTMTLRQAIAEASQNGLYREGYRNGYGFGEAAGKRQAIAEAEKQEPVGWIDSKGNMICTKINESCKPLYTIPQQRTWVGLTDEEMLDCLTPLDAEAKRLPLGFKWFAQAIEAKLKDKK